VDSIGLSDFGKPGNYFGRQVDRWTKQYRLSETEQMEPMERLIEWLPRTLPEQTRTSVVHGDYRIDNMIFAHGEARPLAVLDWELSTLGDPLADFTYFCMAWSTDNGGRSGVQDLDRAALGIPELDEVVARYCEKTHRDGLPGMDWYLAYNCFRLAGIIQGIREALPRRHRQQRPRQDHVRPGRAAGGNGMELRGEGWRIRSPHFTKCKWGGGSPQG
jgi:aminoglycoside phosphotransferase (APT) family kinase protein